MSRKIPTFSVRDWFLKKKNLPLSSHGYSCPHMRPLVLDLHQMPHCHNLVDRCLGSHCCGDCLSPEGSAQCYLMAERKVSDEAGEKLQRDQDTKQSIFKFLF